MKGCRFQTWLLLVVSGFFLSPLFWTTFGCGGSTVTQSARAATAPTVDITGTVTVPTTTASSLISALGVRVMKNETTDSAGSGLTCAGFTLEGETLGEATSDTTGIFTLAAGVDALKPTDATTTSWTAKFYIQCTDADGKYDIRNYCEASVDETSTSSISCSADPDTTLTTMDLLEKSGCAIGASCSMAGIDPICFMQVQNAAYRAANTTDGTGVEDDLGAMKEVSRLCMAATTPVALGFNSPEAMMGAIRSGAMTSVQMDACGASPTQQEKYADGATAATHLRDIFYTNIAGGAGISASLSLQMKNTKNAAIQAEAGSACDMAKNDAAYTSNLVATYGKAKDASELETMKNTAHLDKTILAAMGQYCPNSLCDFAKFKPEVLTGTLSGCEMDLEACGFTDVDGNLQDVFGKMRLAMDGTERSGVGADPDKLRNLGMTWGNAFMDKGIGAVAGDEDMVNRTAQLFGSKMESQGTTYDPAKGGDWFNSIKEGVDAGLGGALDACILTATTVELRIACYNAAIPPGSKPDGSACSEGTECSSGLCGVPLVGGGTVKACLPKIGTAPPPQPKANGQPCAMHTECISTYCGGTVVPLNRSCKAPGTGMNGDVCVVNNQCGSGGSCTAGFCAGVTPLPALKGNGQACEIHTECGSTYCGGAPATRACKAAGTGAAGDVCGINAQCFQGGSCVAGRCEGVTPPPPVPKADGQACTLHNECISTYCGGIPMGAKTCKALGTGANGDICMAGNQCSSTYCGGIPGAPICKAVGTGTNGDVCLASNQCSSGYCGGLPGPGLCAIP